MVSSGVQQGSVLGPVLFIFFVNDVVCCMTENVSHELFADDAKFHTVIKNVNLNSGPIQHSLDLVVPRVNHLQFKLCPTKCSVMR